MFDVKSLVSGAVAVALSMGCADHALAHRMQQRVFDTNSGRSFRTEVAHRHTRSGRVILLDDNGYGRQSYRGLDDNGYGRQSYRGQRDASIPSNIYGAPVVSYRTYTTSDPYSRGGYRYDDRDGYRYYRDNNNSILGRVLQGVVQGR